MKKIKELGSFLFEKIKKPKTIIILAIFLSFFVFRSGYEYLFPLLGDRTYGIEGVIKTYIHYIGKEFPEIEELNENIDFPVKLNTPQSKFKIKDGRWIERQEVKATEFHTKDGDEYIFRGFPDHIHQNRLCYFSTGNPKYHLFGYSVGDDGNKLKRILEEYNYQETEEEMQYKKGTVLIRIGHTEENEIVSLNVQITSTMYMTEDAHGYSEAYFEINY